MALSEDKNKESVQRLFDILYGDGGEVEDIDEFVAEDYIQHAPMVGPGRQGLKAYFRKVMPLPDQFGGKAIVEVNHVAEGDFVVRQEIKVSGMLVDIFRARDGILLEHWDAYRPDPGTERIPGFLAARIQPAGQTIQEMGRALTDITQPERNKQLVENFMREIPQGNGDNLGLIDEFMAEDYVQHNPDAGQGREGVKHFFSNVLPLPLPEWLGPEGILEVNYIAEDDLVVRQEIRTNGMLIDIFRVRDGKLAEHWDAYRPNPGEPRIPGF
jgi:predicted SnoaL-like aldol condensation-catalyzing enzyme